MKLAEKQQLFSRLLGQLIGRASILGFEVVIGEAYRTELQAAENVRTGVGVNPSCHMWCLAVDLNLFRDGMYLTGSHDYEPLGEWWEQQHDLCRWGGRFMRRDGGHFSLIHNNVS